MSVQKIKMRERVFEDRPREKLMMQGRRTLTNAEVLAILIQSGTKEEDALALSSRILNDLNGDLNVLGRLSLEQLCRYPGIGKVKALMIIAALELGRRREGHPFEHRPTLTSSQAVFGHMRSTFLDLNHEEAWVLFLDRSLKMIRKMMIGKGGIDFTPVDLKVVFRNALECSANSLILTHNHPSGNLQPSDADILLTRKFIQAGYLMDLVISDHIIFADNGYYSLRDEGLMDFDSQLLSKDEEDMVD